MTPRPDGFVLGGGASVRMGQDKAGVVLADGRTMAATVADALRAVCGRVFLVRHVPEADWPELPVIVDAPGDRHPLRGVAAALAHAATSRVLVAPCDLAGLTGAAVAQLWATAGDGVAVAGDGERLHPLLGVFRRDEAADVLDAAEAGLSVRAYVVGRPVVILDASVLGNVNTPSDVRVVRANRDAIG